MCQAPRRRHTSLDSTSSRNDSASNSGACTTPLKPVMALRTSSGFFCQNCDKNSSPLSPPSSCILIAAIIVCRCLETCEGNLQSADQASLRTTERPPDALQAGQPAPLFSLPDADMETVELGQFRGKKHVVLYFYPKDGTPNCTLEATDSEVCRKYGVVHEKEANGSRKSCITRSTFVIDKQGTVRHVFYGVNPRGHAARVLDLVRSLR